MHKELLYQNKKIFYRSEGIGKPVLFIHGFGENGEVWKTQIGFLKDNLPADETGFKLIIPDLPGSGKSEMIDDMSIEGMAEVIKTILDDCLQKENISTAESSKALSFRVPIASGMGEACIIGHSMGGYVTLAFAEKYPEYLKAFGLFHSTAYADNEEKKTARRKAIEFISQHGASEFLKNITPGLFSSTTKDERPELIDQFISGLNNFSSSALVSYYMTMMQRPDRTTILKKATVPILFIIGEQDNAVPLQDSLRQCHLPEKSYIHILHHSGHMGMLEEAYISNYILKNFLLEIYS
jgi:pimeloyl-ACP methyl ester carboxylesterase